MINVCNLCCECVVNVWTFWTILQPNVCTIVSCPRRGSAAALWCFTGTGSAVTSVTSATAALEPSSAPPTGDMWRHRPAATRQHFVVPLGVTAAAVKMHY